MSQRRILVIRHAEKTGDPKNIDLSPAGATRAHKLADYIPATFGTPQILIATALSAHSDRPVETLTPLSQRIGLSIESNFGDKEWAELANDLMVNPRYLGTFIVVCWHHGTIPALMQSLGVSTSSIPNPWPDDVFNLILDTKIGNDGRAEVTKVIEPF